MNVTEFLNDRKTALTKAVMDNDWILFRKYCKKYGIPVSKNRTIMMAACYIAVQGCNDISDEVKKAAFEKCLKLGFSPLIDPKGIGDAQWLN